MNIHDINFAAESLANRCDPTNEREAAFAAMLRKSIRFADDWRDATEHAWRKPSPSIERNFANDPTL
jgi:hypothetical protein